jgi:PDZ domain-containing protein
MPKSFFNKPLKHRILRGFVLAIALSIFVAVVPTPYQLNAPGRVEEVGQLVEIQAKTYPSKGTFLLPTVVSENATILYVLYSLLDSGATLTTRESDEPMAQSPQGDLQMGASQYFSTIVALKAVGHDVRGEFEGLRVLNLNEDSPNRKALEPDDLLIKIEDTGIESFQTLRDVLDKRKPGDVLQVTVKRNGQDAIVDVTVFSVKDRNLLGAFMRPEFNTEFPFPVRFETGTTSGASGGLVFALEIYNQLTPGDITKGRRIAATGTLDPNGRVGPIEGIDMKLIGAQRAQAQVVLIPQANVDDVSGLPPGVEVISVETFNEALHALEKF